MWTRVDLKSRAKAVLRNNYWRALLISLVLLISGASYSSSTNFNWSKNSGNNISYYANRLASEARNFINSGSRAINNATYRTRDTITTLVYRISPDTGITRAWDYFSSSFNPFTLIIIFGLFVLGFFMIFFRVLIGFALEVGARRYFVNAADNPKTDFKPLGIAFMNGNYFNVLITMFLRSLYTFLWTLLFIIPGIIKSFSYSMVPYILADNPKLSSTRALELSEKMTYGHKWEIFVLNLSFIGWYILGSLCFAVGVVFVYPYENATKAELYLTLRNNALDNGTATCEELCLTPVYDYVDMTDTTDKLQ